jgi:hypothetical protein
MGIDARHLQIGVAEHLRYKSGWRPVVDGVRSVGVAERVGRCAWIAAMRVREILGVAWEATAPWSLSHAALPLF